MTRPELLEAVRKVMAEARQAVTITRTFVLPYDGLVSELIEQGIPESTVHRLLFDATMAGDLAPHWRSPELNPLNFALIPKEDSTQCTNPQ